LEERFLGKEEVAGSIPVSSTFFMQTGLFKAHTKEITVPAFL
jgi:hypothetical protein